MSGTLLVPACLLAFLLGAGSWFALVFLAIRTMAAPATWRAGTKHPVE